MKPIHTLPLLAALALAAVIPAHAAVPNLTQAQYAEVFRQDAAAADNESYEFGGTATGPGAYFAGYSQGYAAAAVIVLHLPPNQDLAATLLQASNENEALANMLYAAGDEEAGLIFDGRSDALGNLVTFLQTGEPPAL